MKELNAESEWVHVRVCEWGYPTSIYFEKRQLWTVKWEEIMIMLISVFFTPNEIEPKEGKLYILLMSKKKIKKIRIYWLPSLLLLLYVWWDLKLHIRESFSCYVFDGDQSAHKVYFPFSRCYSSAEYTHTHRHTYRNYIKLFHSERKCNIKVICVHANDTHTHTAAIEGSKRMMEQLIGAECRWWQWRRSLEQVQRTAAVTIITCLIAFNLENLESFVRTSPVRCPVLQADDGIDLVLCFLFHHRIWHHFFSPSQNSSIKNNLKSNKYFCFHRFGHFLRYSFGYFNVHNYGDDDDDDECMNRCRHQLTDKESARSQKKKTT